MSFVEKITGGVCLPWRETAEKPSIVHLMVAGLIYTPFLILFLRLLRVSLTGFCWSLDIFLHLLMLPCKIILTLLNIPLNMCEAYKNFGGKCPKKKKCSCNDYEEQTNNEYDEDDNFSCDGMSGELRSILDN